MSCKNCLEPDTADLRIHSLKYSEMCKIGDKWHIYVNITNNSWIVGDSGRVGLYHENTLLACTEKFSLGVGEVQNIHFSGTMPSGRNGLLFNVSVVEEELFGLQTSCSDAQEIYIPVGAATLNPELGEGEIIPPTPSEDDKNVSEWLMDNLVLILVLVLALVVIIKLM